MGRRRAWMVVGTVVGALLVAGLVVGLTRGDGDVPALATGGPSLDGTAPAPKVSGVDVVTGAPVDLASYLGKPVFVNLWASWCGPCREEAPDILRFTKDRPDVAFIGIDLNDTRANGRAFAAETGWTHPSIFDPGGRVGFDTLKVATLPATLYIDAQGRVRGRTQGTVTYEDLVGVADRI